MSRTFFFILINFGILTYALCNTGVYGEQYHLLSFFIVILSRSWLLYRIILPGADPLFVVARSQSDGATRHVLASVSRTWLDGHPTNKRTIDLRLDKQRVCN